MMSENSTAFTELSQQDLEYIASHGNTKSYPKNSILINEGDESDFLYIIKEGRVKVYVSEENGKEAILNIQGPGEYFGELALIDEAPRSATVVTTEPSKLVFVSRMDFEKCMASNPALSVKLIRALSSRVRELTDVVKNLALHDVYGRVAQTLLKMSNEKDGIRTIEQKLTHQDIANMVGASREMVSRIMKDLATGGYIQIKGKQISIPGKLPSAW